MARNQRTQGLVLAGLVVVLAAVVWWQVSSGTGQVLPLGGTRRAAPQVTVRAEPVQDVALDDLEAPKPEPADSGRDPFRFGRGTPRRAEGNDGEEPGGVRPGPVNAGSTVPMPPPPPSGPPPITLKFIGIVDEQARQTRLAVLSDGRNVFYGHEGDIIEGRYRIVRIGVESIEMAHADGRGRQTIRLSGS